MDNLETTLKGLRPLVDQAFTLKAPREMRQKLFFNHVYFLIDVKRYQDPAVSKRPGLDDLRDQYQSIMNQIRGIKDHGRSKKSNRGTKN